MMPSKPTSFKLFIVEIVIVAIFVLMASFTPGAGYVVVFAFILILTLVLTVFGIYSGLKHKADDDERRRHNRIGLWGNFAVLLFVLIIIVYAISFIK